MKPLRPRRRPVSCPIIVSIIAQFGAILHKCIVESQAALRVCYVEEEEEGRKKKNCRRNFFGVIKWESETRPRLGGYLESL